jgi:hypothetical protein
MMTLTSKSRILLAREPADFRRGIDGFQALCRNQLAQDPKQNVWFVFLNRSRTQVRILHYDDNGFWLMTKRLSQGHFPRPDRSSAIADLLTAAELSQLVKGWIISSSNESEKVA